MRVSGYDSELDAARVQDVAGAMEPEPIQEHYVVVGVGHDRLGAVGEVNPQVGLPERLTA